MENKESFRLKHPLFCYLLFYFFSGRTRYITTYGNEEWWLANICNENRSSLTGILGEIHPEKLEYDWIKVFRTGKKSFSVTVDENTNNTDRIVLIEFDMLDFFPSLKVTQKGKTTEEQTYTD